MNRLIVLLRGINVSGRNKLPMKELRALLTSSDFQNVQTYIQSGNIILDSCHSVKIQRLKSITIDQTNHTDMRFLLLLIQYKIGKTHRRKMSVSRRREKNLYDFSGSSS